MNMDWCILRTAASRTLSLAAALEAAGYCAWTPQESRPIRVGPQRKKKHVISAMTPTIVFADYARLPELVALSRANSSRIPNFRVFKHLDLYPKVSDRGLDALRWAEQQGRPCGEARQFQVDETVKTPAAGFEGLVGRVAGKTGRYTIVDFPGLAITVKIPAQSLLPA